MTDNYFLKFLSLSSLIHHVQELTIACKYVHAHAYIQKNISRFWGKVTWSGNRKQGLFFG